MLQQLKDFTTLNQNEYQNKYQTTSADYFNLLANLEKCFTLQKREKSKGKAKIDTKKMLMNNLKDYWLCSSPDYISDGNWLLKKDYAEVKEEFEIRETHSNNNITRLLRHWYSDIAEINTDYFELKEAGKIPAVVFTVITKESTSYKLAIQKQFYDKIVKPLAKIGCTFETSYKNCNEEEAHLQPILIKHKDEYIGVIMPIRMRETI